MVAGVDDDQLLTREQIHNAHTDTAADERRTVQGVPLGDVLSVSFPMAMTHMVLGMISQTAICRYDAFCGAYKL